MAEVARPTLGGYMSAVCFRYLRFDAEETAGRALIISAGKTRGHSLADDLKGVSPDDNGKIVETLDKLLGLDGTRLCVVKEFNKTATGYQVKVEESACSYGLTSDEPVCAFTLGVFIGIAEVLTGKRVSGSESDCLATGKSCCVYNLEVLG